MSSDHRKTVFITGCSSGIGESLAVAFNKRGFQVFATAREIESIAHLASRGIATLSLTVDDEDSVKSCYNDLCRLLGTGKGLDILINNAGRNYTVPASDIDLDEVHKTFSSNLFGVMHINQTFLPLLLQSKGTIVNIGSVAGVIPYLFGGVYNASKAALHAYANTLRVELAPFDVHVLTVVTGGVKSNIARIKRTLPPGSLWGEYRQQYERRVSHSQEVGMDTMKYAEQVVRGTIRARGWLWNSNEIWAGAKASQVWWVAAIDLWFPGGLWRFIMPALFNLKKHIQPSNSKRRA